MLDHITSRCDTHRRYKSDHFIKVRKLVLIPIQINTGKFDGQPVSTVATSPLMMRPVIPSKVIS
jgi:hypothetical protein